ncbi:N-acetylglucosamine kinase-like BadF-type ATPase [Sporomusaceae bacterium BoRhaA]|uniref:N-acetylglucosamine kinase n=1 Tax=Pelorhabdus rhamnosifermentans TaxID=2772457 RepID=UPI001C062545|nr:BadF/BadG/BcrA/BcrD ATPase family protein [Pelorhabdus rhamnosifermentans]MBU2699101.1 N-acetylglucosamine kinase-like BadF-type ATPase [Pelorhabdus rhamnosifermentans]
MEWVLGIDGGGSKTRGWAADRNGKILSKVEKGPSNHHVIGNVRFRQLIRDMLDEFATTGLERSDLQFITFGLAGMDRQQDKVSIGIILDDLGLKGRYMLCNDAEIALAAGVGKLEGIVAISGTGSIAYGVNAQGECFRAGGWGHVVSDEGSGYYIARQALVRSIKAAEGLEQPTILLTDILAFLQITSFDDLITFIYHPQTTKNQLAVLSKVVANAAEAGDVVAIDILNDTADQIIALIEAVIARGFAAAPEIKLVLFGSILQKILPVRERVIAKLQDKTDIVCSEAEPVSGAIMLALQALK